MDDIAKKVCRAYPEMQAIDGLHFLSNAGGFSGARLWRVQTQAGTLCLRAWPPVRHSEEHLSVIHQLMQLASPRHAFVPRVLRTEAGHTCVHEAGRLWEMTSWQPGVADFHRSPTVARLEAALQALAQLHRVWEFETSAPGPCPAVFKRLERLSTWTNMSRRRMNQLLQEERDAWIAPLARRAWDQVHGWAKPALLALQPWAGRQLPSQFCLCDIWHDHVLFDGEQVTGIVDYGGVGHDTVAADLARLLGSLVGDDSAMRQAGLAAYEAHRPLSTEERELVTLLDWTGVVVGAGNWLRWLYLEGRRFENTAGVVKRLTELVTRMEGWGTRVPHVGG